MEDRQDGRYNGPERLLKAVVAGCMFLAGAFLAVGIPAIVGDMGGRALTPAPSPAPTPAPTPAP